MNHSIERHRRLYALFRDTDTKNYRHELVWSFSHGRTEDSSELSEIEINELIRHLEFIRNPKPSQTFSGIDPRGQQMRRRIFSLCYTLNWTLYDSMKGKHLVDIERLSAWIMKFGYLHKGLNLYTFEELPKLVTQFENMVRSTITPAK